MPYSGSTINGALIACAVAKERCSSAISLAGALSLSPSKRIRADALTLSSQRAQSVVKALIELGFPADRVLQVVGVGANRLKFAPSPSTPANRRVIIVVPYQLKTDKEATHGPT